MTTVIFCTYRGTSLVVAPHVCTVTLNQKFLGSSDGQGTFPVVDCVREQLVSQKCFVPCTQCRRAQPKKYFYTKRVPWNGVQVPPIGALNKVKVRVQVRLGGKLWGVTDLVFYVVVYALMCLAGQAPRQNCS